MGIFSILFSSDNLLALCVSLVTVLAITLIFKTQTTTNFAQTTIATLGCYLVAKLMYEKGTNIWLAFGIGLVVCLAIGLFIDVVIIRNGRHVNPVGKQIITMGLTYVLLSVIAIVLTIREQNGAPAQVNPRTIFFDINEENVVRIGDFTIQYNTLFCFGVTIVLIALLMISVYLTKWGLGVRMTASNETVAQMMGVNTHVITAISWSIAAVLGCAGAVFINNTTGKLGTSMMSSIQIVAFLGCIVGGFTTFWGPLVASAIIWLLGSGINVISTIEGLGEIGTWKDVIIYAIAMILVLLKPTGLFGKVAKKKV